MGEVAYIGIGSNLGNRLRNIKKAIQYLKDNPQIKVQQVSSIYETFPLSSIPQGYYLNAVLRIETDLNPFKLLDVLKGIEIKMGRIKKGDLKNEPRIIDLDILLYGNLKISTAHLTIPHPRMWEREFVIKPLKEIAPEIFEKYVDNKNY